MTGNAANGSSDYEDHLLPSQKVHTGVLKMRGLPFAATPDDIVYWFNSSGLPIEPLNANRSAAIHLFSGLLVRSAALQPQACKHTRYIGVSLLKNHC